MSRRKMTWAWVSVFTLLVAAAAHAAPGTGKLSGMVVDPSGVPQMGATVWLIAENAGGPAALQMLTDQRGLFSSERLLPGLYTVRVTLAGFLPAVERHVRVSASLTTLVKIELDSVFASLDRLRRRPALPTDPDEWKWVLRASAAMRPVLQWLEGDLVASAEPPATEAARRHRPRGRVELTSGALRPGSVSNLADSPATAFSYDQKIGRTSRLLLAGQMSYERASPAGAIATVWLPAGEFGRGPETTLVLRQATLGPGSPTFRGLRMEHVNQLALGDRVTLDYGAEYILVGLGAGTSSLRPRGTLGVRLSPNWRTSLIAASQPWFSDDSRESALQSAVAELDTLPAVLWRNGRPVLESGWHEEMAFERRLGRRASVQAAAFHDRVRHQGVFGRGGVSHPDYFQDFYSDAFVYDGGASGSWGTRVAYRQKLSEDFEVAAVYAWAGALALEDLTASLDLRDALKTRYRHSLAARVSGRVPRTGTRLAASYKWLSGPAITRQDRFGEAVYRLDPYLNLSVRQPLPSFVLNGRVEALADFRNLLAQGYVPISGRAGRVLLVPTFRSFRGGVSFQF